MEKIGYFDFNAPVDYSEGKEFPTVTYRDYEETEGETNGSV